MKSKTQHKYAPKAENKNATKVAVCKLRVAPKILATATVEPIFTKNATRNLWLCIRFFFCMCVTLGVGSFFYFYYIIFYI